MTLPLLVLASQLADLAAFAIAVRTLDISGESNLAMAGLYGAVGLKGIVAVKCAGAVLLALLALHVPRRWALAAAAMGIVGAITGLLALL